MDIKWALKKGLFAQVLCGCFFFYGRSKAHVVNNEEEVWAIIDNIKAFSDGNMDYYSKNFNVNYNTRQFTLIALYHKVNCNSFKCLKRDFV